MQQIQIVVRKVTGAVYAQAVVNAERERAANARANAIEAEQRRRAEASAQRQREELARMGRPEYRNMQNAVKKEALQAKHRAKVAAAGALLAQLYKQWQEAEAAKAAAIEQVNDPAYLLATYGTTLKAGESIRFSYVTDDDMKKAQARIKAANLSTVGSASTRQTMPIFEGVPSW